MHWKSIIPLVILLSVLPRPSGAMERSKLFQQSRTYLRITNVSNFWNRLDEMYVAELRKDEQFRDFSIAFAEKLKTKSAEGTIPLGLRLLCEQLPFIKGEAVAATTTNKDEDILYQMAAAMTEEKYRESLRRGDWQQTASSAPIETLKSDFQGLEIIQSIENGGTPEEESYWRTHINGTLLISGNREWVEKNIVKLQNETIDEPTGNKLHCHLPLGPWIRDSLKKKKSAEERAENRAMYQALGFLSIKHYLLDLEIKEHEVVIDGQLIFFKQGEGLFSLLDTTPGIEANPRMLPPESSSFLAGRIDLAGFWKELPRILSTAPQKFSGPLGKMIDEFQKQTEIDIGNDLLAHTDNQFTYLTVPVAETNQSILISLELKDGQAMEQSLDRLFSSPLLKPGIVEIEAFRGRTIYSTKSKEPDARPFALCPTASQLLFGNDHLVRECIQRLDNNEEPEHSALPANAGRHAPDNACGVGAMNHRKAESLLYVNISDSRFSAGLGFQTGSKKENEKKALGENEISFNYVTSFLQNSYNFAEAVSGGIHHRIIFEHEEPEGV